MEGFRYIGVNNWRQFAHVDIQLNQQTTVLAGSNGSGKTTILNILGHHFGWSLQFVSTPYQGKETTKRLWSDIYRSTSSSPPEYPDEVETEVQVGRIGYESGGQCSISTNTFVSANYHLNYHSLENVSGLFIPSHRPVATYQQVDQIPTNPISAQQHYDQYRDILLKAFGSAPRQNPGKIQKQSLISLAVFGEGNSSVAPNWAYYELFREFQEKLRIILPADIGFQRIEIRMPEVVVITETGDFALDAMSGGINSVFGIAWQIFMAAVDKPQLTIVIDEPENHLHPRMQRMLLPNLAKAFPRCRFIVATHSPFIVSSFPDAAVYALFHNEHRRVQSTKVETADLAGTPNTVLREILDVESNVPIWVEEKIGRVINDNLNEPPNIRSEKIMEVLSRLGISDAIFEYAVKKKNAETK